MCMFLRISDASSMDSVFLRHSKTLIENDSIFDSSFLVAKFFFFNDFTECTFLKFH